MLWNSLASPCPTASAAAPRLGNRSDTNATAPDSAEESRSAASEAAGPTTSSAPEKAEDPAASPEGCAQRVRDASESRNRRFR